MRWSAVLLAAMFVPLPVMAQDGALGEPLRVLDDETGDYYASLNNLLGDGGPGINDPIPYYTFMDMDWLDVTETDDGFTFTIAVVNIQGPLDTVGFSDGGYFWIHFRHNDWDFQLDIERPSGQATIEYGATLRSKFMDADDWGAVWSTDEDGQAEKISWDMTANTISVDIDRELLGDSRGASPYPGRSLDNFWVVASQRSSQASADFQGQTLQFPWRLGDRMPDTGVGDIAVNVMAGLQQTGNAFLRSDQPFRASNGEATTFLYTVYARNTGSSTDLFSLETVGAPPSWDIELPLAGFELAGDEELAIPVLVTTPFSHDHGGTDSFVLEMRSTTDTSSVGRIELGVRYLAIAQPGGHHPNVYLHSVASTNTASFNSAFAAAFQPTGEMYFNTLETDDKSDGVAVSAFGGVGPADFLWLIPLDPSLRMGLDADMDAIGSTDFRITSPLPIEDATLDGSFILRQAGEGFSGFQDAPALATFSESGFSLAPGTARPVGLDIVPQEAGDYVPYAASNELWLMIELSGTGISAFNQNTVPSIAAGGSFQLPLLDYEDDISDAFNALTGARMVSSAATRDANPGDVLLYDVDVTARDAAVGTYRLSLSGTGTDHAEIVTDTEIAVGATANTATVLVQVPEDAKDGERIEVFLQASHTIDSQRRGIIRLVADVDTDAEHADDSVAAATFLGDEEKESPAPVVPLLGTTLLALAVAFRRRSP